MAHGATLRCNRCLDDILAELDSGPNAYTTSDAARMLGVRLETLSDWRASGRIAGTRHKKTYTFTVDALRRLARDLHGVALYDLDDSEAARGAVLRMIERWNGGVATVQQLHDAAGVQPIPPLVERDYSRKTPAESEEVTCNRCGCVYSRPADSDARWLLCRRCSSYVRQRAARLAKEYVAWCRRR